MNCRLNWKGYIIVNNNMFIDGIGICINAITASADNIRQYASSSTAADTRLKESCSHMNYIYANCDSEMLLEAYNDDDRGLGMNAISYGPLLADVIKSTDCISLTPCTDIEYDSEYLLFQPLYPWEITSMTKYLTRDKIRDILEKHVKLLTGKSLEQLDISFEDYHVCLDG